MNLTDFLLNKEWYDNSKISTIISCPRKAYYAYILSAPYSTQQGLEAGVGPGADFGTCIHGAIATYYGWWGRKTEQERRAMGGRSLAALHESLFVGEVRKELTNKHLVENGLGIFDHYCDTHLPEDDLLKPVEVELSGAVEIKPNADEDFKPFWYVFRIDGIHQRITYGDYWVRETKTTSGGVKREIVKLKLSRQPRGYLYCARQFPGVEFVGVLPDVVGVLVNTREVKRTFHPKPLADSTSWRAQTVEIVEEWRQKLFLVNSCGADPLAVFYQQTGECTAYGQCSFYRLCDEGINANSLSAYKPNTWNPLELIQAPLDLKQVTINESDKIKESFKL